MTRFALVILLLSFGSSGWSTVYGKDDRMLLHQMKQNKLVKLAHSAMAKIPKNKLRYDRDQRSYTVVPGKESILCAEEKFSEQPTVSDCSGFLISDNLVMTAGHCFKNKVCDDHYWVFGYHASVDRRAIQIPQNDVYSCEKIIEHRQSSYSKIDYAVFQLDRRVEKQLPVSLNHTGDFRADDELILIGYPLGMPTTVAAGGRILQKANPYIFSMEIDGFGGNSGSMVVNARTMKVEGVFQYGDQDLQKDERNRCMRLKNCGANGCQGEVATRVSALPFVSGLLAPFEPEPGRYQYETFLKNRFRKHPELRYFDMIGFCLANWPDGDCFKVQEIYYGM